MYKLRDEGKIRLIGQPAYYHEEFKKLILKVKPYVLQSFTNPVERNFIDDGNQAPVKILKHIDYCFRTLPV